MVLNAVKVRHADITLCLLYIYIYMSSAHNLCKQIGPRTGPTKCQLFIGPDLNPICLTLRTVFLIEFFKIIDFEKKSADKISQGK